MILPLSGQVMKQNGLKSVTRARQHPLTSMNMFSIRQLLTHLGLAQHGQSRLSIARHFQELLQSHGHL